MIKNPAVYCITAISVSDVEKSTQFYNAAFGYRALKTTRPDNGAAGVTARFIELGGSVLELVEFRDPPPPEQTEFPMSRVGLLSHLAFNVNNLADTEAAVKAAGGNPHAYGAGGPGPMRNRLCPRPRRHLAGTSKRG
jgi:catechol 2,3-dioxygenase-like lactoylglutathione lyase family enzyme